MALSNSQYNTIMRTYQQQQLNNKHDLDSRVRRVYEKVPAMKELEDQIQSLSALRARKALEGDGQAVSELRKELIDMRRLREEMLEASGFPADYMQMKYRCADCQDTGYQNGKKCHCFQQARIRLLYAQSNLQEVLKKENFDTFSFDYYDNSRQIPQVPMTELEYMKVVVSRCKKFAENFGKEGGSILFTGSTGVGKTFLTNCIAKELIDQYFSVIYLSSSDLFDVFSKHKFTYEVEDDLEEQYQDILQCDMLIIDDLGTEINNTFVSSQLFYCVNERMKREKGSMISTNLSVEMLRDAYSDRVTSRIMSHYTIIPLYGGDIRVKKRRMSRD